MKHSLVKRWYDLSSQELPREVGAIRPRDFDALPFGTFLIDREGMIHDWQPAPGTMNVNPGIKGRSIFSGIAPCFFIRPFHESLSSLFRRDEFDETFFFTFRFPGDYRQAQISVVHDADTLVRLTIEPIRMIRPRRSEPGKVADWRTALAAS